LDDDDLGLAQERGEAQSAFDGWWGIVVGWMDVWLLVGWMFGCWLDGCLVVGWMDVWLLVGWMFGCWLDGCLVVGRMDTTVD
jgi:hypothetical protein